MTDFVGDPEWLHGYREGRREALERVYRAYVRQIDRYLRSLARAHNCPELGQASAIADFLQEVFTRAFSRVARQNYDGQRDLGAYVTTIARNCFIDALRARGREVPFESEEALVSTVSEPATMDDGMDPFVRGVVAEYVSGLSPELRQVYLLRFADGESQDDACATLGLSRRTLRTREAHLRKGLRRALVRAGVSLSELRIPPTKFAALPVMLSGPRVQP
jgi:RNA polymerase sigma factor (sigma-70 family)